MVDQLVDVHSSSLSDSLFHGHHPSDPPHRRPMLHPSYIAVLKRFRVEGRAGRELPAVMTSRETGGYSGAEWWLLSTWREAVRCGWLRLVVALGCSIS